MRLHSDFAALDVKHGRKQLNRMIDRNGKTGAETHDLPEKIPVIIHGFITHRLGDDDGEGQEFGIEVTKVETPACYGKGPASYVYGNSLAGAKIRK